MGKRRRSRECAVQCLYQWDMTSATPDSILERFWEAHPAPPVVRGFAEELVRGALAAVYDVDQLIGEQAEHWRFDRMGRVERSILRLGVYELMRGSEGTPAAVVIDEAIELAKRFCGEEAAQFVNGVLDGVRRRLQGDEEPVVDGERSSAKTRSVG